MSSPALNPPELDLLRQVFRRFPEVQAVWLFGSRAKGTHRPSSDVDLALDGNIADLRVQEMRAELDELPLPYGFDVVALSKVESVALREHIARVGHRIYASPLAASLV